MTDLTTRTIAAIQTGLAHKRWLRPAPEITADTLFADLGCDCVDMVCVACAVEEELHIEVPDDDAAEWASVGDVIATVERMTMGEVVRG